MNETRPPRQLRAMGVMTLYALLAQARNPATLAFGLAFPLVFVVVFGLIGNSTFSATIGLDNPHVRQTPVYAALSHIPAVKFRQGTPTELRQLLQDGKIDGILEVTPMGGTPPGYAVTLLSSSANPQNGAAVQALVRGAIDQVNLALLGATKPPVSFASQSTSGRVFRYIDFALPGQIGFALLSTAIFGTAFGLIFLKKALVLKRMFATPVRGLTVLMAQGLSRLVVAVLQTIVILLVGVFAFPFFLPHGLATFLEMLALSAFALIVFLGFGLLIAGNMNDENAAAPLTNLITLPQFLLSGTFFPTDSFPSWLQPLANNLPLSYLNAGMRQIASNGASLGKVWPYFLGLAVWGALSYIAAARTFKWQ